MNFFKPYQTLLLLLLALPVAAQKGGGSCPPGATAQSMIFEAGVKDAFREPTEETSRSEALNRMSEVWMDFDEGKSITPLGHTFADLPCMITSATLTVIAMPYGKSSYNDTLSLGLSRGWMWQKTFADLTGRPWVEYTASTINIDLGEAGLLQQMMSDGFLDVFIQDVTRVDYMRLTIEYCAFTDCNENCYPDSEDIKNGTSKDDNRNGIPDECETIDIPPELICPPTVVLVAGSNCCATTTLAPTPVNVEGDYQITNNVDPAQAGSLTYCFPVGATTVTFTLNDYIHPTVSCTVTVIVTDNQGPVIMPVQQ